MKPANDPTADYKALVQKGYDSCAAAYSKARRTEAHPELALLTSRLSAKAAVLDVGCGTGVPVTRILAKRFQVTGVDISSEMIGRARANVPGGEFIQADIMTVDFPQAHFDAVVAFYSIFHLPREEHPTVLERIHGWLKPGGYLLATVTIYNEEPYTEDDFFGVSMFWSNFSLEEYEQILADIGFDLLRNSAIGDGYKAEDYALDEVHPLIFARKE